MLSNWSAVASSSAWMLIDVFKRLGWKTRMTPAKNAWSAPKLKGVLKGCVMEAPLCIFLRGCLGIWWPERWLMRLIAKKNGLLPLIIAWKSHTNGTAGCRKPCWQQDEYETQPFMLKTGKRKKKKYLRDFIKLFAGRLLMPETERAEHLKLAIQWKIPLKCKNPFSLAEK